MRFGTLIADVQVSLALTAQQALVLAAQLTIPLPVVLAFVGAVALNLKFFISCKWKLARMC